MHSSLFRTVLIALGLSVLLSIGAAAEGSLPTGYTAGPSIEGSSTPEPITLTMFGMALVGLAMLSRLSRYMPMSDLSSQAIRCQVISVVTRK
jgi:hypothetical protein